VAQRGLTLLEVLIGLALLGIVLAMAAPGFDDLLGRTRLTTQVTALSSSLAYARSEAIRRGTRVTVCTSDDPGAATPACSTAASWADGWLVFADNVHTSGTLGTVDSGDVLLRIGEPLPKAKVSAAPALANWVSFASDLRAQGSGGVPAGAITLCQGAAGRAVAVLPTGRVAVTAVTC
jgi:type IV fimbrial biogenesis protein FimT